MPGLSRCGLLWVLGLGGWSRHGPERERFGSGIGKGGEAQGHTRQEPLEGHPGKSLAVNTAPSQMVPKQMEYSAPLREKSIIYI